MNEFTEYRRWEKSKGSTSNTKEQKYTYNFFSSYLNKQININNRPSSPTLVQTRENMKRNAPAEYSDAMKKRRRGQPAMHENSTLNRRCECCNVGETPEWRKGNNKEILCNACGLKARRYQKKQGISVEAEVSNLDEKIANKLKDKDFLKSLIIQNDDRKTREDIPLPINYAKIITLEPSPRFNFLNPKSCTFETYSRDAEFRQTISYTQPQSYSPNDNKFHFSEQINQQEDNNNLVFPKR